MKKQKNEDPRYALAIINLMMKGKTGRRRRKGRDRKRVVSKG